MNTLRMACVRVAFLALITTSFLISGCLETSGFKAPELLVKNVLSPAPGVLAEADGLSVSIVGLEGKVLCTGNVARISADGLTCEYGRQTDSLEVYNLSSCKAYQLVQISYIGSAGKPYLLSGVYDTTAFPDCDSDRDGVVDSLDKCPAVSDNQSDRDGDGLGDACDSDADGDGFQYDGITFFEDNCPLKSDAANTCLGMVDSDNDGIDDSMDNCVGVWNKQQGDDDADGLGNVCDTQPVYVELAYANDDMALAFLRWRDQVKCEIAKANGNPNCTEPGTGGDMGSFSCLNSGTASWRIELDVLSGTQYQYFDYSNCRFVTAAPESDDLTLDGYIKMSYDDLNKPGIESGSLSVSGDFSGFVHSYAKLAGSKPAAGHLAVNCSNHNIAGEKCADANAYSLVEFPHKQCANAGCDGLNAAPLSDGDGDKVYDRYDNCPSMANPTQNDSDANGSGDICADKDSDGVDTAYDNCPDHPNGHLQADPSGDSDQLDSDADGLGNACDDDDDNDGVLDVSDNCRKIINPYQAPVCTDPNGDHDGDGVKNNVDLCPGKADQQDDDNGYMDVVAATSVNVIADLGDICEADEDEDADTQLNRDDNCPYVANVGQQDTVPIAGADGKGDHCSDYDLDGIVDVDDTCPEDVTNTCHLGHWYTIRNTTADKCLQMNGGNVGQAACNANDDNQRWSFVHPASSGSKWMIQLASDISKCVKNDEGDAKIGVCSDAGAFRYTASNGTSVKLDVDAGSTAWIKKNGCLYATSSATNVTHYSSCALATDLLWELKLKGVGGAVNSGSIQAK